MKDRLGTLGQQNGQLSDKEFYRQFLKEKEWPEDTAEDLFLDEMFRMELDRDVEREEALLAEHPEITGTEPSPDLFDRIMEKAAEMDAGRMKTTTDAEVEREKETDFRAEDGKKAEKTEDRSEEPEAGMEQAVASEENGVHKIAKVTMMKPGNAESPGTTNETADDSAAYHPEDFLSEEDRKALEIGRKRMRNKKKHGWMSHFAVNAAILACVFFVGVSTEANRTRIVNVINTWVGDEALVSMDNETDRENYKKEEFEAFADIEDQLGIKPVRFMQEVDGMAFDGYEIDTRTKRADMYYVYNNTVLTIVMYKEEVGTAKGSIKDGSIGNTFEISSGIGEITAVEIDGNMNKRYMTEFIYDNTYYHIFCELPKEEFTKLISSIFF